MDASSMTCPKCGWAREPNALDCPACGVVYARFAGVQARPTPAVSDAFAAAPPPLPPLPDTAALNPYAPPQSNLQSPVAAPAAQLSPSAGVWRSGDLLVMQKGMSLPSRCLVCNQPASVQNPKKLYWHNPGLYLLLFIGGPLVYAIGALVARKKADVALPFCAEHEAKRKKATTTGTLLIVFGLVLMLGSCTQIEGSGDTFVLMAGIGFLLLVAGAIVLSVGANPVLPKKIDDYYVWLRKVGSTYLATLPPAPPGL